MNKKGFTLIEIIAVIVIIGVLLLIAVPAVSSIIFSARNKTYANNASSFMDEVDALYKSKKYGPLLEEDQIMIVPIKDVTFEKNNYSYSPYGIYDYDKSYVIIVRSNNGYKLYASIIDDTRRGVFEASLETIKGDDIKIQDDTKYVNIKDYFSCSSTSDGCECDINNNVFYFNSTVYKVVETRDYDLDGCIDPTDYYPILVLNKQ